MMTRENFLAKIQGHLPSNPWVQSDSMSVQIIRQLCDVISVERHPPPANVRVQLDTQRSSVCASESGMNGQSQE